MPRPRSGPTLLQRSRGTSSEEKARYHHALGAGRGRVIRRFFDLNDRDQVAILDTLERGLERLLKQAG